MKQNVLCPLANGQDAFDETGASWTAAGSGAPRRFRTHEADCFIENQRAPESSVAANALPPQSKMSQKFSTLPVCRRRSKYFVALAAVFLAITNPLLAQEKSAVEKPAASAPEVTPTTLPGAETFVYRAGQPEPMRLFVFKPKGWRANDHRPALVFFFGGGWTKGTPERAASYAKWAATLGLVGIAPDYRTRDRFNTSPLESVADGRAALRWVQEHAGELGIDSTKIVAGGSSAGGHVALWTAIAHTPPGSDAAEAPLAKPCALILVSPVSDTSSLQGYTPKRFGTNAEALSPVHQLDAKMPPVLVFHGDADTTVTNLQSIALEQKLLATGNVCERVNVPGGSHGFQTQLPEWKDKSRERMKEFLTAQKILPVVKNN
jgi:acetyl esterase/lipase